jgi:Family of unknown function (DUF6188)
MKMYGLPKDFDGSRLVGHFLLQICYGVGQIQLRFDETLTIAVTSSLLYKDPAVSQPKKIDIPGPPAIQSDLLNLLHHNIVKAFGDDEGTLTMEFDDGHVLQCLDNQPGYEAYEIKIGNESIIV